jgi:hypothetical protein
MPWDASPTNINNKIQQADLAHLKTIDGLPCIDSCTTPSVHLKFRGSRFSFLLNHRFVLAICLSSLSLVDHVSVNQGLVPCRTKPYSTTST